MSEQDDFVAQVVSSFAGPDGPVPDLLPPPVTPVRKAGLGDDQLDKVTREIASEVRDFAQEMLHRVLRATSHENFGRAMRLIERISRAQADFTVDLIPGVERFERDKDRPGGLGEGNDLPSIETFGASMMRELTGHLTAQQEARNKPDINKLLNALEKAEEMGQTKVVEALQRKIEEVAVSGNFNADAYLSPKIIGLPPARLPKEEEDADDVVPSEDER